MKKYFLIAILLLTCHYIHAQDKITISGYVRDKSSGENLTGAAVSVVETKNGAITNDFGFYSITLPAGYYHLKISYIGFVAEKDSLKLTKNIRKDYLLSSSDKQLNEVTVNANSGRQQVEKTQMGKIEVSMEDVKKLPVLFGEVDILKTLQLLPGVQGGSEGTTGFYVRGGGPDQNLILLDGATVYNASHLFGFFSVFNGDAVKNFELYKGGYPANYGGRLSSVIDVNLKEGNSNTFSTEGGIGLISSRLLFQGPLIKNKCSFIISARRTYVDLFTKAYNKSQASDPTYNPIPDYYFYDLNAKINYTIDSSNRLYLSGYFGRDVFGYNRSPFNFSFDWGNATGTARWNHLFGPKLFLNSTATYTNYQYTIGSTADIFSFSVGSSIQDWALKEEFDYSPNVAHAIKFGGDFTYHTFGVGRFQLNSSDNSLNFHNNNTLFGADEAIYASDDWQVSELLKINYGGRLSAFNYKGSNSVNPEPRVAARYKLGDVTSWKLSYTRMSQYVHLVSNSGASLPTDVWYPTTSIVKPQKADQIATGFTTLIFGDKITITDEVYYKWLYNQVDFKDGAQLFLNPNLEQEFIFGKGWSYGNELLIQKSEGRLTGWIGYTLAWSYRHFDSLLAPYQTIKPKYDVRNDIKVVGIYEINKRLSFSMSFIYNTGTLTTMPIGYAAVQGIDYSRNNIVPVYQERDNYRMPYYMRLDLGLVWKFHPKWGSSDLSFSIYNALNRRNPYFIYIATTYDKQPGGLTLPAQNTGQLVSLFPIIPSVTYNFKF